MSDRPPSPDPGGPRRRRYAAALSALQGGGDPYAVPGPPRRQVGPSGALNPLTGLPTSGRLRGGMYAQALAQPTQPPAESAPSFQPLPGLGAFSQTPAAAPGPAMPAGSGQAAGGQGAPIAGTNPGAPGALQRISTRVPTDVAAEARDAPHTRNDLEVGLDAARQAPDAYKKNANLIRSYSHVRTDGLNDDQVHEAFVKHLADNLVYVHNQIPEHIRASSKRWYDGARAIAEKWAQEYGLETHQVAGVLAALSPQKDWFQNVDLAKRLLDMHQRGSNYATDPAMREKLQRYVDAVKNPDHRAAMQAHVDAIGAKPLGQISDPMQRALWMRAYDEAHNARDYRVVTPEGEFGDYAKTKGGKNQKVAWGSFKEIHKAMQAIADPSLENISRHMGGNHKVRNFYNNIISPLYGRDATVDTHAIAAANMMPLGSGHHLVGAGLGLKGASAAATGTRGLYAHYIEAHRQAAKRLGILPRELQSITWEGIRGTYTPEQKRDKKFVQAVQDVWDRYGRGEINGNAARKQSLALGAPQGIRDPQWVRSGVVDDVE